MRLNRYLTEAKGIKSKLVKGLYGKVRVIEGYKNYKKLYVHKKGKSGYMVTDTERLTSLDDMIKIGNEFWFGTLKELHTALNEQTSFSDLEMNILLETIHKECKPWVKEIKDFSIKTLPNPVFRGVKDSLRVFRIKKGTRRPDRVPKFTAKQVFEIYDKAFADRFGWWVRSKGVFTGGEHVAHGYGNPYVFMPIGKYRYVWSNDYQKVWHNLTHPDNWEMKTDLQKKAHLVDQERTAKNAVKFYQDKNIREAMRTNSAAYESIFECKKYLLINYKAYIAVSSKI